MISEEERKLRTVHKKLKIAIKIPKLFDARQSSYAYDRLPASFSVQQFVDEIEETKEQVLAIENILIEQGYDEISLEYTDGDFIYFAAKVPETDAQYQSRINQAEAKEVAAEKRRIQKEKKEKDLLAKLQKQYKDG